MFQGLEYIPLLHARLAEIRALEGLEQVTKQRIFPVIRVRPWLNSKSIERAYEVVENAVGDGFYGFDLDPTKYDPNSEREAVQEFSELFSASHGFENYYNCVASGQYRVPVFREIERPSPQIGLQIEHASQIGRGLIVRVPIANPGVYLQVAQQCISHGLNNTAFIFDCGWRQDALQQAGVTIGLVNSLLDLTEDFEISIAASTFPSEFANRGTRFTQQISEREYFDLVRNQLTRLIHRRGLRGWRE